MYSVNGLGKWVFLEDDSIYIKEGWIFVLHIFWSILQKIQTIVCNTRIIVEADDYQYEVTFAYKT